MIRFAVGWKQTVKNLRLNSCRVVRYGTRLNGDMCITGTGRFHHNPTAQQCATGSADVLSVRKIRQQVLETPKRRQNGFLRITKHGCYPKQPNSPSLLTITTCRSGSEMPLSITSFLIDSIRGTVCRGKSRQTSLDFSVEHSAARFRNLTTFNRLDAMRCGSHHSLQARLTTATMRQIITPLNLDSAQTRN